MILAISILWGLVTFLMIGIVLHVLFPEDRK